MLSISQEDKGMMARAVETTLHFTVCATPTLACKYVAGPPKSDGRMNWSGFGSSSPRYPPDRNLPTWAMYHSILSCLMSPSPVLAHNSAWCGLTSPCRCIGRQNGEKTSTSHCMPTSWEKMPMYIRMCRLHPAQANQSTLGCHASC